MVLVVVDEQARVLAGNGHCVLLLLQWLQDAPAYRDMQGGGAGLSAPAAQPSR